MSKLIVQEFVTIDGFAAAPNGDLDFMPGGGQEPADPQIEHDQLRFIKEEVDTMLLGRTTYQIFVDYWPTATTDKDIIADELNALSRVVASRTLDYAPWGDRGGEATIVRDGVEAAAALKRQSGKGVVVWGSLTLAQSLMRAGLVDEWQLYLCPGASVLFSRLTRDVRQNEGLNKMKVVKISTLERGWCDKDHLMLHAVFQLLVDFVEQEKPDQTVDWNSDPAHKQAWKEIQSLYRWWTQTRPARKSPLDDKGLKKPPVRWKKIDGSENLQLVDYDKQKYSAYNAAQKKHWRLERKWNEEDQGNLHRLIEIRQFLWT